MLQGRTGVIDVVRVAHEATFPLRHVVLGRPESLEQMAYWHLAHPEAVSFAVFKDGQEVIGAGEVYAYAPPWAAEEAGFRIVGMATAEAHRNRGVGSAVLAAVLSEVEGRGGGLLWCKARISALNLYLRADFRQRGQPFIDKHAGEQVLLFRQIP